MTSSHLIDANGVINLTADLASKQETLVSGTNIKTVNSASILGSGDITIGNPTGTIIIWPSSTTPSGYLLCDGSAISRTTYSALFSVIGTTYGVGDGSSTFNLPNSQNIITDVTSSVPCQGSGLALGLASGTSKMGLSSRYDNVACANLSPNAYGVNSGTTLSTSYFTTNNKAIGITTDSSKSGIVGTVTSSKLLCRLIIKY